MKEEHYIGPNMLKSKHPLRSLNKKIELYQGRLEGWFIDIAKALKSNPADPEGGPGADPVSLMIAVSLFEPLGILLQGNGVQRNNKGELKSKENFKYGFRDFLLKKHSEWAEPKREEIAEMVYTQVRCGLFHFNAAKKGIVYYRGPDEQHLTPSIKPRYYAKKLSKIVFNVPALIVEVDGYFKQYVAELRKPRSQRRKKFAEGWKIIRDSSK